MNDCVNGLTRVLAKTSQAIGQAVALLALMAGHGRADENRNRVPDVREGEELHEQPRGVVPREMTRAKLLQEVEQGWQRSSNPVTTDPDVLVSDATATLRRKLNDIVLPQVSFTRAEIGQVVGALSSISQEFDPASDGVKGINVVLLDPENRRPQVTLVLRQASLKRVLDFVTASIGY